MENSKIKKPNFFIIGTPRSGTTSLYMYLKEHSNIFFNQNRKRFFTRKEPIFFCTDFSKGFRKITNMKSYLEFFQGSKNFKAVGDASTWYLFSKEAIPRIEVFNSKAKFIVMVRNPIDVAYSRFVMSRYYCDENIKSFKKSWYLQGKRRKGKAVPRWCRDPKLLLYGEIAKTGQQIERLLHFISRNRVKIIVFDNFVNNTKKVYKEVLEFLNLEYNGKNDFPVYNKGRNVRSTTIGFLVKKLYQLNEDVNWGKFFGWNIIKQPKIGLSPKFEKELKSYFRRDVKKLSKILDRDLMYWVED